MRPNASKIITKELLGEAISYEDYRKLIESLLSNNKTTGENQSPEMVHYTTLNQQRMRRLDKTTRLTVDTLTKLEGMEERKIWLVLTEAWCGDAAQILPVLNGISAITNKIGLYILLRDEQPKLMDQFLTNGGRSIPKVIQLNDETLEVEANWGPRPAEIQAKILAKKKEKGTLSQEDYEELMIESQKWYLQDKTVSIQREVLEALLD